MRKHEYRHGRLVASPVEEALWLCGAAVLVIASVVGIVWAVLALGEALWRHDWRLALAFVAIGLAAAIVIFVVRLVAALLAWAGHQLRGG